MKLIIKSLLLFVMFLTFKSSEAQNKTYIVPLHISSRIDTTYDLDKKAIFYLLKNYLEARPDSFYNNPYWSNKEKSMPDSLVIADFYKGFYSLHKTPEEIFNKWKPFVLTIEKLSESKYQLRFALIEDEMSSDKILTIVNLNAIKEDGRWRLSNTFNDIVNSWKTKQYEYIKYVYPSSYSFNIKLAEKSVRFCDSISKLLKISPIDSFSYFITDKPDDMGLLFGYEFYNQNYTTGLTNPEKRQIFSAKGNEYYPHEFVHSIINGNITDTVNYIIQEGIASFLGELNSEKYINRILYLSIDYLGNKPTYTLKNLLTNTSDWNGYQTAYPTGSIIVEIIYDMRGFEGIKQLLRINSSSEEKMFEAIKQITKLNRQQFENEFRKKLTNYSKLYLGTPKTNK